MPERVYPAKLLLFGEHVLLRGAPALAIPVAQFSGQWAYAQDAAGSQQNARLAEFVRKLPTEPRLDRARLLADVEKGLFFAANIPQGYGLGSSGALCAALYDQYAHHKATDLAILQQQLGAMESPFHGQSSGIDPLTSYIRRPLHIVSRTQVTLPTLADWPAASRPVAFLLNTHLPRQTGPLVTWFLAQSDAPTPFSERLKMHYLPAHHALVDAWLSADAQVFWPALATISAEQLHHWTPMIPAHEGIRALWKQGLTTGEALFKICGAGGGGYVLGFAKSQAAVTALVGDKPVVFI